MSVPQARAQDVIGYRPDDKVADRLTAAQARQVIEREVADDMIFKGPKDKVIRDRVSRILFEADRIVVIYTGGTASVPFDALRGLGITGDGSVVRLPDSTYFIPYGVFRRNERAIVLADALHAMFLHHVRGRAAAAEQLEAAADAVVAPYIGKPRPEFPEAARRSRVQAEFAVEQKRWEDAARLYDEALKVAPWWPEGRFNRALVLGELQRYVEAMSEMKRFISLAPEHAQVRAAQDQIYRWESVVPKK